MNKEHNLKTRTISFALILLCLIITFYTSIVNAQTIVETIELSSVLGDGIKPVDIGINSITNRIYTVNADSNNVSVINGDTHQVIDTVAVGENPGAIAVNILTNKVYVANKGSDDISVIDGETSSVINIFNIIEVEGELAAIAVNHNTNLIYAVKNRSGIFEDNVLHEANIIVIDGSNNQIISIIETMPELVTIKTNTESNLIYALSAFSSTPPFDEFDNKVRVIDGLTNQVISTIEVGLARAATSGFAINKENNRAYVSNSQPVSSVEVIDTINNQIEASLSLFPSPDKIVVNTTSGNVFLINNDLIQIIDAVTNQNTFNILLSIGLSGIDINTDTNLIYVTNRELSNVTVIMEDNVINQTPSPFPTLTPSPTPNPTLKPTSTPVLTTLTVEPSSSKSSLRLKEAIITVLDQNNLPISGLIVEAIADRLGALVIPSSATTDSDGKALFKYRFKFITKNGEISFNVNGLNTTIKQD